MYGYFQHKYPILSFNQTNFPISEDNKFTAFDIKNGIDLVGSIQPNLTIYSNEEFPSQSYLHFRFGPEFTYGKLRNYFLDYSRISVLGEQIYRFGESPFSFDYYPEYMTRLSLNYEQQIYGPLIGGISTYYYMNYPNKIDRFNNIRYMLSLNRRPYSLEFYYDQTQEEVGFKFNIIGIETNFQKEPFSTSPYE